MSAASCTLHSRRWPAFLFCFSLSPTMAMIEEVQDSPPPAALIPPPTTARECRSVQNVEGLSADEKKTLRVRVITLLLPPGAHTVREY